MQKREKRGKKMIVSKDSMLCPSADRSAPALPLCHTKLGSRTAVLPCTLPISRTSASSLSYCHRSGCHNCLRANSPVCLQTPSPCTQVPCWPVSWEGDSCVSSWVQETACSFSGSPPATTSPMPGATLRGWNTWQEHHAATTALAPVPFLCFAAAFPK